MKVLRLAYNWTSCVRMPSGAHEIFIKPSSCIPHSNCTCSQRIALFSNLFNSYATLTKHISDRRECPALQLSHSYLSHLSKFSRFILNYSGDCFISQRRSREKIKLYAFRIFFNNKNTSVSLQKLRCFFNRFSVRNP